MSNKRDVSSAIPFQKERDLAIEPFICVESYAKTDDNLVLDRNTYRPMSANDNKDLEIQNISPSRDCSPNIEKVFNSVFK